MVVESLNDDEHLLDSILIHMGNMYSALGKLEESLCVYQRAIGSLEMKYGKYNAMLHRALCSSIRAVQLGHILSVFPISLKPFCR